MNRHTLYFKTGSRVWITLAAIIVILVVGTLIFVEIQTHWQIARYFVFPVLGVMIIYITGWLVHNTA